MRTAWSYLDRFAFKHVLRNPKLGRKRWTGGDAHQLRLDDVFAEVAAESERHAVTA